MIRPLQKNDFDAAVHIVNENWKSVYAGYVNPDLLNETGCRERERRLKDDFTTRRLSEYVWEENHQIYALLSMGQSADTDKSDAFEIWRVYVKSGAQGGGIGGKLLAFAEQHARADGYQEVIIWAFRENTRALEFYQKHGYRIDTVIDGYSSFIFQNRNGGMRKPEQIKVPKTRIVIPCGGRGEQGRRAAPSQRRPRKKGGFDRRIRAD